MLTLLALVEFLNLYILRLVQWMSQSHRSYYRCMRIAPIDKHNHRYSSQKPDWLKYEIIRLKARMPQAGCRTIADICNRRFAASRKITVGKTYVHETLQRHTYEVQILRRNLKQAKPKSVPRNLIWGIDLTGKTDAHKSLHSIFGIIDHGSRALLHLQCLHDKTSHSLISCITEVIRTYGKPKIIRTDNEAIFTSNTFREGLRKLGIRHQRTTPGCPWQNGRIERLFGTLKQVLDQLTYSPRPQAGQAATCQLAGLVDCLVVPSEGLGVRAQLNRDLNIFQYWYNHIRPHQNLDGCTPAEAWNGIDPYVKLARQEHWFEAWDGLLCGYHLRY